MHLAARYGRLDAIEQLVAAGMSVDVRNRRQATPLILACQEAHLPIVRWLVDHGADVNAKESHGQTPLLAAARVGWRTEARYADIRFGPQADRDLLQICTLLLDRGADVNATDVSGTTPLHQAARNGSVELATVLLDHGANPEAIERNHGTVLRTAVNAGQAEMVCFLLQHRANPNPRDARERQLLLQAVGTHSGMAKILIPAGMDCSGQPGQTALYLASERGDRETADLLTTARMNDPDGLNAALFAAVQMPPNETDDSRQKRIALVHSLLDRGAAADGPRGTNGALMIAIVRGEDEIATLLRSREAAVAKSPDDLAALNKGQLEYVIAGKLPELARLEGAGIPLGVHAAAALGRADRLRKILKLDPSQANAEPDGLSPLSIAAREGQLEAAKVLVDAGAKVNPMFERGGWFGSTPLEAAAFCDHADLVEFLIAHAADINVKDQNGDSLLTRMSGDSKFSRFGRVTDLLRKNGSQ